MTCWCCEAKQWRFVRNSPEAEICRKCDFPVDSACRIIWRRLNSKERPQASPKDIDVDDLKLEVIREQRRTVETGGSH